MLLLRRNAAASHLPHRSLRLVHTSPVEVSGFRWDFRRNTVELSRKRRERYTKLLEDFRPGATLSKVQCSRIASALSLSSFAIPDGQRHLREFHKLISQCDKASSSPNAALPIPDSIVSAIQFWRDALSRVPCEGPLTLPPTDTSLKIYVDASPWGVGLVVNGRYGAWKFGEAASWGPGAKRDNNWAELVAVELVLNYLVSTGVRDRTVIVRTDSIAVEALFQTGATANEELQRVLRRILHLGLSKGLWVRTERVEGEENPADAPSRGEIPSGKKHLRVGKFTVPGCLAPFIQTRGG